MNIQPEESLLWKYMKNQCSIAEIEQITLWLNENPLAKSKLNRFKLYESLNEKVESFSEDFFIHIFFSKEFNFEEISLKLFQYQAKNNCVYQEYLDLLKINTNTISSILDIPFLPIEFFKSREVKTGNWNEEIVFQSSGTTAAVRANHYVKNLTIYEQSIINGIQWIDQPLDEYVIIAFLPNYYENKNSSLLYMVNYLMQNLMRKDGSKFIHESNELSLFLSKTTKKIILFGVSFALLDFVERNQRFENELIIIETGGMKSLSSDLNKDELLAKLIHSFPKAKIYSEFGMTEMLSQAYTDVNSTKFHCSSTMKVLVNDESSPLESLRYTGRGRLNIVDLCNIHSCAFLQTGDGGEVHADGTFTVHGRILNHDIRGCHQLMEDL